MLGSGLGVGASLGPGETRAKIAAVDKCVVVGPLTAAAGEVPPDGG